MGQPAAKQGDRITATDNRLIQSPGTDVAGDRPSRLQRNSQQRVEPERTEASGRLARGRRRQPGLQYTAAHPERRQVVRRSAAESGRDPQRKRDRSKSNWKTRRPIRRSGQDLQRPGRDADRHSASDGCRCSSEADQVRADRIPRRANDQPGERWRQKRDSWGRGGCSRFGLVPTVGCGSPARKRRCATVSS